MVTAVLMVRGQASVALYHTSFYHNFITTINYKQV